METTTAKRRKAHSITKVWDNARTADDRKPKRKLDANDYAGIWSDDEYMDADELVDAIHTARHFKDRTKFWDEL